MSTSMLKIIALSGFKGSGKDTVAQMIKNVSKSDCKIHSMADPIRNTIKTVFHLDAPTYQDKEKYNEVWSKRLHSKVSYRDLVNSVGESLKNSFGHKIWVWNAEDEIYKFYKTHKDTLSVFVIPDIRYKQEIKMLNNLRHKFDVYHWLILRKSCLPEWASMGLNVSNPIERKIIKKDFEPSIHESDWCFANPKIDFVIKNDGTLDELQDAVNRCYFLSVVK